MSQPAQRALTEEEYFALELGAVVRHEFVGGQIYPMAGGSVAHNRAARNALVALDHRLRGGPCEVFGSDMRLRAPTGLLTCPDVVVICGEVALMEGRTDTATNPSVIVEVLSPSTRAYDLGPKLADYQHFETLTDVVFVDPDRVWVRHVRRTRDGWAAAELHEAGDALQLGVGGSLPLTELYRGA